MTLIDDEGRLFGRVNLIDAVVGAMFLSLLLLGYGAFRMFGVTPTPKIIAVSPTQVPEKQPNAVWITGENLRPFLDARFGTVSSGGFSIFSPTRGQVIVPDLLPGTYDLTLLDKGTVVATMANAVTVLGVGRSSLFKTDLQALGVFVGLTPEEAATLKVGSTFSLQEGLPTVAEVVAVLSPTPATQQIQVAPIALGTKVFITVPVPGEVRARAILRFHCTVVGEECRMGDLMLTANQLVILPVSDGSRPLKFVIDEVRPADARVAFPPASPALLDLRIRFVAPTEVLAAIKVGDFDVASAAVLAEADRAQLKDVATVRQATTMLIATLQGSVQLQQPASAFIGTVRVPVVYTVGGWTYKDRVIKVGGVFHFEGARGAMTGVIVDMKLVQQK